MDQSGGIATNIVLIVPNMPGLTLTSRAGSLFISPVLGSSLKRSAAAGDERIVLILIDMLINNNNNDNNNTMPKNTTLAITRVGVFISPSIAVGFCTLFGPLGPH